MKSESIQLETKPHYDILDGLRGVAALVVICFHIMEPFSGGDHLKQIINHGYLAVDFFFVLSGFVLGYAYDDRWKRMSLGDFIKRRLIRLQPMIIAGSVLGAALFYLGASNEWPLIAQTPIWKLMVYMIIGCTLIPVLPSMDIRGWQEMHPLNGPAWSLFFEYCANIAYALIIRRLPNIILTILLVVSACFTLKLGLTSGDVVGGWSINSEQLGIGFTRLAYPFLAGLLLSRVARLKHTNHAFLLCSVLLIAVLAMPRIGNETGIWVNGLYECICIIIVFPFIVWLAAGGSITGKKSSVVCKFLGDISYPIYITHFPLIYIFSAWIINNNISLAESIPMAIATFVGSIVMAFAFVKLYDLPIRNWLRDKILLKK